MSKLITVADFCRQYAVSRTQFYRYVNDGIIPLIKLGRMSRVKVEDAETWLASLHKKAVAL